MVKVLKEFHVKKLREPTEKQIDDDIEWVCTSLGFMTPRDHDKTAIKILNALIKAAKEKGGLTSEELTQHVNPTIGSVIYHLKKLMKAGLIVKLGSTYELRMKSLLSTIDEIQKDIIWTLSDIKKVAKDIDDAVGLEHRH